MIIRGPILLRRTLAFKVYATLTHDEAENVVISIAPGQPIRFAGSYSAVDPWEIVHARAWLKLHG